MSSADDLPWIEKYRPRTLDAMSLSTLTREAIENVAKAGTSMPHLMLHGPPGTGKTSCAWILIRQFFKSAKLVKLNTLSMNASDERGIESIRQIVSQFASSVDQISLLLDPSLEQNPMQPYKIVVLDECDSLTSDAQAMLRGVVEESAKTCRFIFLCNNISKMIAPLVSRCRVVTFGRMDDASIVNCLAKIVHQESLHHIGIEKLAALVDTCRGDARQAINHLSIMAKSKQVSLDDVYQLAQRLSPAAVASAVSILVNPQSSMDQKICTVESLQDCHVDIAILLEDMSTIALQCLEGEALARWIIQIANIQAKITLGSSSKLALYSLALVN